MPEETISRVRFLNQALLYNVNNLVTILNWYTFRVK